MENFKWDTNKPEEILRKEYKEWCNKWQKENPGKLLPSTSCYVMSEPEVVGQFPIRNDIEILPYKEDKNIGWTIENYYSGAEITKPGSPEPLTKESDLQVGDKIIVPTLFGNCKGVVDKNEYGELYARIGKHSVADLHFAIDDRKCWVTTCAFNTRGLKTFNQ